MTRGEAAFWMLQRMATDSRTKIDAVADRVLDSGE